MNSGKFIVITGLDGSGTSSLGRALAKQDPRGIYLQTPNGTFADYRKSFTQALRNEHPAAHYLYLLSSVVAASNDIEKLLKNHNVYCVRYLIDTVVSHRTQGLDVKLNYDLGFTTIVKPDLTLFVNIDESVRQTRICQRGKSDLDKTLDNASFRNRFKNEFLQFDNEFEIVDNSGAFDECLSQANHKIHSIICH